MRLEVHQLWPPDGDNRVTNMDVVFFSYLGVERTGRPLGKPRETWVQKGHPEVCWPQQWLQKDLGSYVRIFEFRRFYDISLMGMTFYSKEAVIEQLKRAAKQR
jgi:hypothetical protein